MLRAVTAAVLVGAALTPAATAKGDGPTAIAVGAGAVWVGFGDGTARRLDPWTRRVGRPIWRSWTRGGGPSVKGLAVGFGFVWVAAGESDLVRIEPRTGRVREIFRRAGGWTPSLVEVAAGAVWVGDYERDVVYRYEPRRNRVTHAYAVPGRLMQLAAGPSGVWARVFPGRGPFTGPVGPRLVVRLFPHRTPPLPVGCDQSLAVAERAIWLSDQCVPRLARLDPRAGAFVASRPVRGASRIALGFGSVWLVGEHVVSRLAPADSHTVATIAVRGYSHAAVAGLGRVWVLGTSTVTAVDPRTNRVDGAPIRMG